MTSAIIKESQGSGRLTACSQSHKLCQCRQPALMHEWTSKRERDSGKEAREAELESGRYTILGNVIRCEQGFYWHWEGTIEQGQRTVSHSRKSFLWRGKRESKGPVAGERLCVGRGWWDPTRVRYMLRSKWGRRTWGLRSHCLRTLFSPVPFTPHEKKGVSLQGHGVTGLNFLGEECCSC